MPNPELGTKRVCPETGCKFYDLKRDPIVSPYTGQSYPLTFFEGGEPVEQKEPVKPEPEAAEAEPETAKVEIVSLEEADEEASDTGETIPVSTETMMMTSTSASMTTIRSWKPTTM